MGSSRRRLPHGRLDGRIRESKNARRRRAFPYNFRVVIGINTGRVHALLSLLARGMVAYKYRAGDISNLPRARTSSLRRV